MDLRYSSTEISLPLGQFISPFILVPACIFFHSHYRLDQSVTQSHTIMESFPPWHVRYPVHISMIHKLMIRLRSLFHFSHKGYITHLSIIYHVTFYVCELLKSSRNLDPTPYSFLFCDLLPGSDLFSTLQLECRCECTDYTITLRGQAKVL